MLALQPAAAMHSAASTLPWPGRPLLLGEYLEMLVGRRASAGTKVAGRIFGFLAQALEHVGSLSSCGSIQDLQRPEGCGTMLKCTGGWSAPDVHSGTLEVGCWFTIARCSSAKTVPCISEHQCIDSISRRGG